MMLRHLLALGLLSMLLLPPVSLAASDELPDLDAEVVDQESAVEEAPAKPETRWYYDFRNSLKHCMTVEEARRERFNPQSAGKPCEKN